MSEMEDTGSISPSGRFARMEAALDRIESKLDLKADLVRLEALETKQKLFEDHVNDLISGRTMSAQSQEYLRRFTGMEEAIDKLNSEWSNRVAVAQAVEKAGDARYRSLMWLVGLATLFNFVLMVAVAIFTYLSSH